LNDEGAPHDSGFDDSGPFADTPPAGGVSLESALRHFGPAAFEDLIPRLQALAADLDEAHDAGFVHGRLHPSRIIVTADGTYLMGRRVPISDTLTPASDQAAFAVIAYEWMFGRRVSPGAAVAPSPPSGVDRGRLSQALTRALSVHEGDRQFASITDFVAALEKAQIPELPLTAPAPEEDDPVGPFTPEAPVDARAAGVGGVSLAQDKPAADVEVIKTVDERPRIEPEVPWQPASRHDSPRFGGFALILATIVGAILGFAAGYMARPRALQQPIPEAQASEPIEPPRVPAETKSPAPPEPSASAGKEPAELRRIDRVGRLLVRSTPTGASVTVDGVARGVTPVAIRDLDLGSREIAVTRRGYQSEERRIVLTRARPSRTVDVRLSTGATEGRSVAPEPARSPAGGGGPRPSTPASLGKPAATTGALAVESRPAGAAVLLNGKPSGTTPVTIADLAPGDYRVTMTLKGFQDFATTVRVVAGERARAAARLTEQEQE
jgi:hypothetical protein